MVHRIPLIVNASANQIQELPTSDTLAGGIPLGGIIMWSGTGSTTAVPTGFTLCDGNSGNPVNGITIPDLRDKFIVGANAVTGSDSTYPGVSMNQTGGSADAIVPNHTHPTSVDSGRLFHQGGTANTISFGGPGLYPGTVFSMNDPSDGESVTNKNLPPFYALAFIIRTS